MSEPLSYISKKYFQKSKNYLFPLLGLGKEEPFMPAGSYLWWNGGESIDDKKLIVTYEDPDSEEFKIFEKRRIFKNPYFESCYRVKGGNVYIFNLSSHGDTVKRFVEGKYSQFSEGVKKKILSFHGYSVDKIPRPGRYIHMSLYPELYFDAVAEELNWDVAKLKEVGELMDAPLVKKETLKIKILSKCEQETVPLSEK